jgi:D-beta-D-heptose 7-phosphate kinase/D-beta-D-heptose 1-phosphate adenosyltransferase
VKHVGTYVLKPYDILQGCKLFHTTKVIRVEDAKHLKHPIIFTNGCFDILHEGHLALFQHCRAICPPGGDVMVAINSDASIRRLKGVMRPINTVETRIALLNSISTIDWIVVFDEDTPYEILEEIRPDTLVKGGDYTPERMIGKEFCRAINIFTYMENRSTTNIIKKILDTVLCQNTSTP